MDKLIITYPPQLAPQLAAIQSGGFMLAGYGDDNTLAVENCAVSPSADYGTVFNALDDFNKSHYRGEMHVIPFRLQAGARVAVMYDRRNAEFARACDVLTPLEVAKQLLVASYRAHLALPPNEDLTRYGIDADDYYKDVAYELLGVPIAADAVDSKATALDNE